MREIPYIVSTEWLDNHLDDPHVRVLDATTYLKHPEKDGYYELWSGKEAYDKEHIPGAVFADLYEELSDPQSEFAFTLPSREEFVKKMSDFGVGEGTYVVIYDREAVVGAPVVASHWATRLAWQLRYEGFNNVAVLDGGFPKWVEEGRPVTAEPGSYPKGNFIGERESTLFSTKEDVLKAIDDENTVIIDSLTEEHFHGEVNTYGRLGHIPNSVNVFFGSHSDPITRELYNEEQLRKNFEESGALDPNKKVIVYCGSAIAATWNATLLNKLGQHHVSVYDGSLTEWASDPSLPMETK
ncbi:sulfurtransferase [Alteribacillus iranensis]|uniref:Thiosulfate/3-mercaptopyruvate sulfurtransferase n=1 Tax=Alteribacillus iranensis TaxID=930128 RepID=A0A1I2DHN0_9BACI|nr:sulfurtransferase [Alteribacillus iranensis]SFE80132.1 thiosulfate/3-mercaptopyruvate sulfurtransferase [Alteribacillus iranensis]